MTSLWEGQVLFFRDTGLSLIKEQNFLCRPLREDVYGLGIPYGSQEENTGLVRPEPPTSQILLPSHIWLLQSI